VVGERGTGKELFATRLHYLSARWDQTVSKVNCAALTESLLESELFGHEAGAFTGAARQHRGCFERADGGTLVLDEIASASAAEARLLRHRWLGNVRELKNVVERAVYLSPADAAFVDVFVFDPFASPWRPPHLPGVAPEPSADADTDDDARAGESNPSVDLPLGFADAVATFECALVARAMARGNNNQRRAADSLGLGYHQFRRLLAKHDLQGKRVKSSPRDKNYLR
jgi:DNA-binding NtrC family response regulator